MKLPLLIICCGLSFTIFSQSFTSYFTGNASNMDTLASGGICLMGGATENDNAMIWFLERANGGDILVLRASGSDGYNDYFFNQLGVTVNSVETIVFNDQTAADSTYIHQRIMQAEAIWFAGGDQWNYISYWRNTAIDSLINDGIQNRNIIIGGTSAGMAILGESYFTAENGTVTSTTALNDPYASNVTVDNQQFIDLNWMEGVITDTHYDNPDRKGRHMTFLARMIQDSIYLVKGIACEEYTAVCIDENGITRVFGEYPTYDDYAYFLRANCSNVDTGIEPENCVSGSPLTWDRQNAAVRVYKVPGTLTGANTFNLVEWESGTGGEWFNWWVDNGVLNETTSTEINCLLGNYKDESAADIFVYPNPVNDILLVEIDRTANVELIDGTGRILFREKVDGQTFIDVSGFDSGIYNLFVSSSLQKWVKRIVVK